MTRIKFYRWNLACSCYSSSNNIDMMTVLCLQDDTMHFYSRYSESELEPIMQRMALLVVKASQGKLTAIYTKYKSSKFMKISLLPELQQQTILDYAKVASATTTA